MSPHVVTLAELLADLRWVAESDTRRASEVERYGEHLVELGWAERVGAQGVLIVVTGNGLDVLWSTRDVVLSDAGELDGVERRVA